MKHIYLTRASLGALRIFAFSSFSAAETRANDELRFDEPTSSEYMRKDMPEEGEKPSVREETVCLPPLVIEDQGQSAAEAAAKLRREEHEMIHHDL